MTDVAASLPELDLAPKTVITVTLSDAGAKITGMVVHGTQTVTDTQQLQTLPPLLVYAPTEGG